MSRKHSVIYIRVSNWWFLWNHIIFSQGKSRPIFSWYYSEKLTHLRKNRNWIQFWQLNSICYFTVIFRKLTNAKLVKIHDLVVVKWRFFVLSQHMTSWQWSKFGRNSKVWDYHQQLVILYVSGWNPPSNRQKFHSFIFNNTLHLRIDQCQSWKDCGFGKKSDMICHEPWSSGDKKSRPQWSLVTLLWSNFFKTDILTHFSYLFLKGNLYWYLMLHSV